LDACREHNIVEVTFHRRKIQFVQMDVNEARRLRELERENISRFRAELAKPEKNRFIPDPQVVTTAIRFFRAGQLPP